MRRVRLLLFCCLGLAAFDASSGFAVHHPLSSSLSKRLAFPAARCGDRCGVLGLQSMARSLGGLDGATESRVEGGRGQPGGAGRLTGRELWVRAGRALGLWVLIAASVLLPKRSEAAVAGTDFETIEETPALRHTCNKRGGIEGAAAPAAVSLVTLGGTVAVAISREKKRAMEDVASLSKDVDRHQSFKDEFLDGHLSDRSIHSGLRKAAKGDEEDEFERNSRMFLEEQKSKTKKKKHEPKRKESPTVLHRPGEGPEESEVDNDDEDHRPAAELDDATRLMLERMLGKDGEGTKE